MFAPEDLSDDQFLGGKLRLLQPRKGYRAATDPVLLAAAVPARAGQTVLDLGCGAGTAILCLGARVPGVMLAGLELQPAYADLARQNAARNGMLLEVVEADLSYIPSVLRRGFDHVIANPPYYAQSGTPSALTDRDTALRVGVPLTTWVQVAARRLNPGGWLTMILSADRLPDILADVPATLGSISVLPLAARQNRAAGRVILQARKGGRTPFRLLSPLVLHSGDAHDGDRESYAPLVKAVLRDGRDLLAQFR